jgi:hypothetical protein
VDYRNLRGELVPIHVDGAVVERVEFLIIHITKELTLSTHNHTVVIKGKTMPRPPQEAEQIWHGPLDPQKVLQLHN